MLEEAGILFDVEVSDTDEDKIKKQISSLPFSEQVVDLAKAKAESVSREFNEAAVIGGDQMCVYLAIGYCTSLEVKKEQLKV